MKNLFVFVSVLFVLSVQAKDLVIKVATFDSGFGGFFTAKAIEQEARKLSEQYAVQFSIVHYGDTANAPYGEKTSDNIVSFTKKGLSRAFQDGAEEVFIACNTASTQYETVKNLLDTERKGLGSRTISIIDSSVAELKKQIDKNFKNKEVVRVAILATPFTVKNMAYPQALARAYALPALVPSIESQNARRWYTQKGDMIDNVTSYNELTLRNGKKIELYQLGPGNWVDMIEHAAPDHIQKEAVDTDLNLLKAKGKIDIIGEFCTHFPVFEKKIRESALSKKLISHETSFIAQGPLMAGIFKDMMLRKLDQHRRLEALSSSQKKEIVERSRPLIFLSGSNVDETRNLSKTVFSNDPLPLVQQKDF